MLTESLQQSIWSVIHSSYLSIGLGMTECRKWTFELGTSIAVHRLGKSVLTNAGVEENGHQHCGALGLQGSISSAFVKRSTITRLHQWPLLWSVEGSQCQCSLSPVVIAVWWGLLNLLHVAQVRQKSSTHWVSEDHEYIILESFSTFFCLACPNCLHIVLSICNSLHLFVIMRFDLGKNTTSCARDSLEPSCHMRLVALHDEAGSLGFGSWEGVVNLSYTARVLGRSVLHGFLRWCWLGLFKSMALMKVSLVRMTSGGAVHHFPCFRRGRWLVTWSHYELVFITKCLKCLTTAKMAISLRWIVHSCLICLLSLVFAEKVVCFRPVSSFCGSTPLTAVLLALGSRANSETFGTKIANCGIALERSVCFCGLRASSCSFSHLEFFSLVFLWAYATRLRF